MKADVPELSKMIEKIYDRSFIPTPIITELEPKVEVKNIWKVPMEE